MTAPLEFTFTGPVTVNQVDLDPVLIRFAALEELMATVAENLAAVQAKADAQGGAIQALAAAFTDLASDVRAALAANADPSVDEQAALDTLNTTLDTTSAAAAAALADIAGLDLEVGDADGSETPPV
jgi:ABC-type transporter Mla subunit MlaD